MIEVVDFDNPNRVVDYELTGRVNLTTLTKEFLMCGFLERDEVSASCPVPTIPGTA